MSTHLVIDFEPSSNQHLVRLADVAYGEFPELRGQGWYAFVERFLESVPEERVEFRLYKTGTEEVVACAIVVLEEDMHVGQCLTVQWNYCLPQYRGSWFRTVYKHLRQIAVELEVPWVAYSHRSGDAEYKIKYRRTLHG